MKKKEIKMLILCFSVNPYAMTPPPPPTPSPFRLLVTPRVFIDEVLMCIPSTVKYV